MSFRVKGTEVLTRVHAGWDGIWISCVLVSVHLEQFRCHSVPHDLNNLEEYFVDGPQLGFAQAW